MLAALNRLLDAVEEASGEPLDVAAVAAAHGTTEHHLRRLFTSIAGMPVLEYLRRRRMSIAATDVASSSDDLLTIAVRYGYGSSEAFGRAFRAVHGVGPSDARRDGGPFRSQQQLRFRLTAEGSTPMHVRITEQPAIRLVGHMTRLPLVHEGVNPQIQAHIASIPVQEHARLKALSNASPRGLLQVTDDIGQDSVEGSQLTYLHGVAITDDVPVPEDLQHVDAPAGTWAVFTSEGTHPQALQQVWAATASEWFPSNPWPATGPVARCRPRT